MTEAATGKSGGESFALDKVDFIHKVMVKFGWPTIILLWLGYTFQVEAIPVIKDVAREHVATMKVSQVSIKQVEVSIATMTDAIRAIEERDRKREAEMGRVVDLMERILEKQYGSSPNGVN